MEASTKLMSPVDERDYVRGFDDAAVTVVEYGDYEDPYSGQAYYLLKKLQSETGNGFKLVFRNFPLTQIRPHALPAALAAEAAGLQASFWDMHSILFEHQDGLEPEHLIVYAQVLGLDLERFIIDMTSDVAAAYVREDFVSGTQSGVNGTPTFYVNGKRYDEGYDYESLKSTIEQAAKAESPDAKESQVAAQRHTSPRL